MPAVRRSDPPAQEDPRVGVEPVLGLLGLVEDASSRRRVDAERAFLVELGGDCDLPAGAHATLDGEGIALTGFLAGSDAVDAPFAADTVTGTDAERLGIELARRLRDRLAVPSGS